MARRFRSTVEANQQAARARRRLGKIVRRGPTHDLLELVAEGLGHPFVAVGLDGGVLFAGSGLQTVEPTSMPRAPIRLGNDLLGRIHAPQGAESIAALVGCLAALDHEEQNLAGEALLRYKELNLLYALTAKLALRPRTTAEVARLLVDEARTLIRADQLDVLLHDQADERLRSTVRPLSQEPVPEVVGRVLASGKAELLLEAGLLPGSADAVLCVPISTQRQTLGVLLASHGRGAAYSSEDLKLATALATVGAMAIENARFSEAARRFVPTELLDLLGRSALPDLVLGDQIEQVMTVLFCDIRGFTTLIEQMSPAEAFSFVNRFLAFVGPVVREHGGFVDKYLGDAVMAIFPHDAANAIAAGVAIQRAVGRFSASEQAHGANAIGVGVGIHRGRLRLGVIGEAERWSGTVIADAVNVAARLEAMTRAFDADILVSEAVLAGIEAPERFGHRRLGTVSVRGKLERVSIYEIFDADADAGRAMKAQTRASFERAVDLELAGERSAARAALMAHLAAHPEDRVARRCLERWTTPPAVGDSAYYPPQTVLKSEQQG